MKVFLDTNVLASGLSTRGLCADVIREVMTEHELVLSEYVIMELEKVLHQKFKIPEDKVKSVVSLLRRFPVIPTPKNLKGLHVRDKNDIPVLGSALSCQADVLITGDRDLLILGSHGHLLILSPRGFWEHLRGVPKK